MVLPQEYPPAPDWVFEALREIHPRYEIVQAKPGLWFVGLVKENVERQEHGQRILDRCHKAGWSANDPERWPIIRNAILAKQGFGLVQAYQFPEGQEKWREVIKEIERAEWMMKQYDGADPETIDWLEGDIAKNHAAARALVERMHADVRWMWSRIIRQNPAGVRVGAQIK